MLVPAATLIESFVSAFLPPLCPFTLFVLAVELERVFLKGGFAVTNNYMSERRAA